MTDRLLSLDAIRREMEAVASRLDLSDLELPSFGRSDQDGRPHIEVGETYSWVVCERGQELERRATRDLDELLYWSFQAATFSLAVEWEHQHRAPNQDFRRGLFRHQHVLLAQLNPNWAARRDEELKAILHEDPFEDAS